MNVHFTSWIGHLLCCNALSLCCLLMYPCISDALRHWVLLLGGAPSNFQPVSVDMTRSTAGLQLPSARRYMEASFILGIIFFSRCSYESTSYILLTCLGVYSYLSDVACILPLPFHHIHLWHGYASFSLSCRGPLQPPLSPSLFLLLRPVWKPPMHLDNWTYGLWYLNAQILESCLVCTNSLNRFPCSLQVFLLFFLQSAVRLKNLPLCSKICYLLGFVISCCGHKPCEAIALETFCGGYGIVAGQAGPLVYKRAPPIGYIGNGGTPPFFLTQLRTVSTSSAFYSSK